MFVKKDETEASKNETIRKPLRHDMPPKSSKHRGLKHEARNPKNVKPQTGANPEMQTQKQSHSNLSDPTKLQPPEP